MFALGVDGTAFYLICAFFGLAMLGMAANEWRRLGTADYGRIAMAAGSSRSSAGSTTKTAFCLP